MAHLARADSWIERAASASGLAPRGIDSLKAGLDIFIAEYNRSRTVTHAGIGAATHCIMESLTARFRMEDWIARHPAVPDTPVTQPVFILGMPRAGTTSLFNMLAHDPQRRFYWNWEANREIPPAQQAHMRDDPRIARKVAEINAALEQGLLDHRQHVEMGDQPAECTLLLGQDFKSILWSVQTLAPGYVEWLTHGADLDAAYRYHRRVLQVLQSQAPGRWTLKFPSHALAIESILRVYPDARIVVTHRDPVKTVASSCDAQRFFLAQGNDGFDLSMLGDLTARQLAMEMERVMAAREKYPATKFLDMHFHRFVADPIGEMHRLYAFLDESLPPAIEQAMRGELESAQLIRKETGKHSYSLETFGLEAKAVRRRFADYIECNDVLLEEG